MTREINLTQGQVALVDEEDYVLLSPIKWQARFDKSIGNFYAQHSVIISGVSRKVAMHRVILGLEYGDKRVGDHINGNTLDNRRSNLRIATCQQNCVNARKRRDNSSGFKGVSWKKSHGKWCAQTNIRGKRVHIGMYATAEDARAAYLIATVSNHGEFAEVER